jgi:hypothetical protein
MGTVPLPPRGLGGGAGPARVQTGRLLARRGLRLVVSALRGGGRHASGRSVARAGRPVVPAGACRSWASDWGVICACATRGYSLVGQP